MRALEIENRFRQLDGLLQTIRNKRIRTVLVFEFIDEIWENKDKFRSYITLVAQHLPESIDPADWSGVSPEQSLGWIESAIKVNHHFENTIQEPFIDQLTKLHLLTLLSLDELTRFQNVSERFGFHPPSLHSNSDISEQVNGILASASSADHSPGKEKDSISNILRLYQRTASEKSNSILIPTQAYIDSYLDNSYGSLRELTIKIQERMPRGRDLVETNFAVASTENASDYFVQKVIEPTRSYLKNNFKELNASTVRAYFRYLRNDGIHDGESSNAALALLFVAELHRYFDKRKRLSIQKNVAITGGLNTDGTIGEVSEESIPYKVEACFFSRIETLVVPESQKEQFREKAEVLAETYPNKEFQILGASTLDDLFSDRRIICSEEIPFVRHLSGKLWKKKFEASGLFIIALLTIVIMRLLVGPIDQNPVMGEFTGEVLKVKNQYGAVLETISVGESTVRHANGENTIYGMRLQNYFDVDGDGTNELFWGQTRDEREEYKAGVIFGRKATDPNLLWRVPLDYKLEYPNKPYVIGNRFHPIHILAGDFLNNQQPEALVVSAHRPFFPGVISRRDAQTGQLISQFVNSGRVQAIEVADLYGDDNNTIIFAGINNAFNMAFIGLIGYDKLHGQSPHTEEYFLNDEKIAEELEYILIPMTKVGESFEERAAFGQATQIQILEREKLIQLRVYDFTSQGDNDEYPYNRSYLLYYFNYDTSIRGIGSSDGYDLAAQLLYDEGAIDEIPDHNYFRQHGEKLLYWDGEEFVGWLEYSKSN